MTIGAWEIESIELTPQGLEVGFVREFVSRPSERVRGVFAKWITTETKFGGSRPAATPETP